MTKRFKSRIRNLEKKMRSGREKDPIEEVIESYDEEQLCEILVGSKFHNDEEQEELRKLATWMKKANGEREIPSELLGILEKVHGMDFTETYP